MEFERASRIKKLPPYLFAELDNKKQKKIEEGVDVIDLGVGDPDMPTPRPIIETMKQAIENSENHKYPSYVGMFPFREAVAHWYKKRFDVELDPAKEVITLIGSKEGIAHFPLAFIEKGDIVLCPDPAYPVYAIGTMFAGGTVYKLPLKEENGFLPDISSIPEDVVKKSKIIWINYPNNPTTAKATREFYERLIHWAKKNNIIVASDFAYSEIYTGKERPLSIFEVNGSKDIAIEFHSLSKTYNMTGWRIGMAVGNSELISALGKVKTNIDSGQFQAVQEAGITALKLDEDIVEGIRNVYRERKKAMVEALESIGLKIVKSDFTFYLWIKVPQGFTSTEFVGKLLDEAGILCTPGNGFGDYGEGYFRISLTVPTERLLEAADRISRFKL